MKVFVYKISIVLVFLVSSITFSLNAFAQDTVAKPVFKSYLYLVPNIGASQYFGDLNKDDFWNKNQKLSYGAVLGYQISPVFGVRGQFLKANLYSERTDKNAKFSSDLWDAGLNLTLNVNEIFADYNDKRFLNIYLLSGVGLSSFKSKIEDLTTGEVLIEHSERQNELFVPVGGGALLRINHTLSVNLEYTDRIIFTDDALDFKEAAKPHDHYGYASAGLFIRFGAKDTDKDGIKDKNDLCPEIPGKPELQGCPDKDNDGIADKDDACPNVAGKAEFKGCPDTDGDGIIDGDDACPTIAGKKELKGCPDRDNDGIVDKDDLCPDVPGLMQMAGCPDRDGDGITDKDDACPDVKGLAQFKGCPDLDGDGIPDKDDKCPDLFGSAANFGCPDIKKFEFAVTVYFATDKSVVLDKCIKDLNDVVAVMKEHNDLHLDVAGYADAIGPDAYNMKLSEKRADYVINYLVKKGVAKDRMVKKYFGEGNPVGDNKTSAGRAKNRRVEIKSIQ